MTLKPNNSLSRFNFEIKAAISWMILFFFLMTVPLSAQQGPSFADRVNDCYKGFPKNNIFFQMENEQHCFIGATFPSFELDDLNGTSFSNEQFGNKVVVMNFWFTACAPCLAEIPHFNAMIEDVVDRDILFVAPTTDDVATVEIFLKQYGSLKSIVLPNSTDFFRKTLASKSGFPTTIVVDKQGVIRAFYSGGIVDYDAFQAFIIQLEEEE